jgi:hypothetical protein
MPLLCALPHVFPELKDPASSAQSFSSVTTIHHAKKGKTSLRL